MAKPSKPLFKRVLLKISGESLSGPHGHGIEPKACSEIAERIKEVRDLGIEIAVVIGGGNIIRGEKFAAKGMDRSTADYMGMLATVINGMALQDSLEKLGCFSRVMTAIQMLEKGRVVIFAGGTGNPFFTTDTAASLRAVEIKADAIIKATKVDGVYDRDPVKHRDARMYEKISYTDVLTKNLKVMDATAISLCRENRLPIVVFNLLKDGNIKAVICGQPIGTAVGGEP